LRRLGELRLGARLRCHPYGLRQRALLSKALSTGPLQDRFAEELALPSGYGVGFDERVVELPWVLSRLRGRTLDAGSSLNHAYVLRHVLAKVSGLQIVTAAPERQAFPELGVSYVFADFRELPFRDSYFDTIACVSSLEHVGMDNSEYGGPSREPDPDAAVREVLAEFRRVLAPAGTLLITVPYGVAEDHGWLRQYGQAELETLVRESACQRSAMSVFSYSPQGWKRSTIAAAKDARYHDPHHRRWSHDLAVAARAVACLELEW
jgi:SAM-dependent methyltransferase